MSADIDQGPRDGDDERRCAADDGVARTMNFYGRVEDLGLEGMLFNTFRIGDEWLDVEELEEIELTVSDGPDAKRYSLEQVAIVVRVEHGGLADMLDMHVGTNHGCVQAMPADRKIELRRVLDKAYGRKLADGEMCVVIYMSRYVRD